MNIITDDIPVGTSLPPVSRQLRPEIFNKGDERNIHTDEEAARREGLPAPVAVGPQVAAVIFKMMHLCFGEGWIKGGRWDLTFRRPTYVHDLIIAKGIVKDKQPEGEAVRVECNVWVEKQDGEKVIVGTASGLVREGPDNLVDCELRLENQSGEVTVKREATFIMPSREEK
ncbi:MAG: MaoC family dehydratase [Patescibacteria group bacterium]